MNHLPKNLINFIKGRKDLIDLGFLEKSQERKLVVWLILSGLKKFPEISQGNIKTNPILNWLSQGSSSRKFRNMPRIFLGIWDIHKEHKRRWPYPELNNFYMIWVQENWNNFNMNLPNFENLFNKKITIYDQLEILIFDLFWNIRKPLSIKSNEYFGTTIDLFFANKLAGWSIQLNVINALIYRELKTRVSLVKGGILGVFIEPLGVIVVFLLVFTILRANTIGPLDLFLFLGSGSVLFTLFSNIAIRSSNGMTANQALFFYKPVKPIDTVVARTIVESGLYGIVFIVIILSTFIIKKDIILDNVALLFITYLALVIFSFGVGLFLMVASHIYPSIKQLIPLLTRPLFFISGVFVSLNALPQSIRPLLSWNPILQAIEITRFSFSTAYNIDKNLISITYLWQGSLISLFFGLFVYSFNEKKLLTK